MSNNYNLTLDFINQLSFKSNSNINLGACPASSYKVLSLSLCSCLNNPVIVVKNNDEINEIMDFAKLLFPKYNILPFPQFNTTFYQQLSPNKSILAQRISTLYKLTINKNPKILVTTATALVQKILPRNYLKERFLTLCASQNITQEEIISFLVTNSYNKVSTINQEGDFAVRGDILDIYPANSNPFRINFFDNIIENIKIIDVHSQKSINEIESVSIIPSSEIILNNDTISNFQHNYTNIFGKNNDEWFDLLAHKITPKGIENYITLFYKNSETLLDYIENPNVISYTKITNLITDIHNHYSKEYKYSIDNTFGNKNDILPPEYLLAHFDTNIKNLYFSQDSSTFFNIRPFSIIYAEFKSRFKNYFDGISELIKQHSKSKFLFILHDETFLNEMKVALSKNEISYNTTLKESTDASNITIILSKDIENQEGFFLDSYFIIFESDITGQRKTFLSTSKKNTRKNVNMMSLLETNNLVVHNKHGIGIYKGLVDLKINNILHDFLEIEYKNNEKLFVPVENMDTVSKYNGDIEGTSLDKLGSNNFEHKQTKIKEKIRDIAYDLIKIAANRNINKSINIDVSSEDYKKFCSEFPYVETDDQLNAIHDIILDFTSDKVADRLICGDVGFGKTEVAMRAAFMVANSGYQVAIITPTTLLCKQHYDNFVKRFASFPIKVEQLSRFVSAKKKQEVKEGLKNGTIDIIIATHALLAKDISFKNIGLVIIDEEQNFGVIHKEKLKTLKKNVHIITLSATPIPRTIQLAFKGIKDLSIISTPPVEKLPISTYILPLDLNTIKSAIETEVNRGGQVYFVCPKIQDLADIKDIINNTNLNISFTEIHGRMNTNIIEQNMLDFQENKYNVLVSTNIIESGLNLTNVNTIIIYKSYMFGLAQLYQLRGRVGRSSTQSYAYLLYNDHIPLTPLAEKRLQILQSLDYLGASFALANYDLELRGAGNLLGEQQSGHVKEIGFDLYQKLLQQEINHIKKATHLDDGSSYSLDYINLSPTINIKLPIFIPKQYISDVETSVMMYQRIAHVKNISELEDIRDEMIDRFGKIPTELENFFISIKIKIYSKNAFVEKIDMGTKVATLNFYQETFPKTDQLVSYIKNNPSCVFKPNGSITYFFKSKDINHQIDEILTLLNEIKQLLLC